MSEPKTWFVSAADRTTNQASVSAGEVAGDRDTGQTFRRTLTGWVSLGLGDGGSSIKSGSPFSLSATGASQRIPVGGIGTVQITGITRPALSTSPPLTTFIRVKFGDATVAASATVDQLVLMHGTTRVSVPSAATYMAYIRETGETADVGFTVTLEN